MNSKPDNLQLIFRLHLSRERGFYGPGTHRLLQLTDETGSLLSACSHMGISYSKGRKIIALCEQQLGFPIIESHQGGKNGGSSVVTQEGKQLISSYTALCEEAGELLDKLFQKHFK